MKLSFFNTPNSEISIFFNVSQSVGRNGQNSNPEDILLVQFLLKKMAETAPPSSAAARERKAIMRKVPLSGNIDQATIDGIIAVQESMKVTLPKTIVDGRVSVAKDYLYGGGYWSIVALNGFVRRHNARVWPRLQDFSDCPGLLKSKVQMML